ncbi:MAG TPA: hypothetical protein VMW41_00285 [Candidatus Bathyarchaeia archaeon]|nr:hypothetical protein [Candidatus Bathyarchaeia archaeon]
MPEDIQSVLAGGDQSKSEMNPARVLADDELLRDIRAQEGLDPTAAVLAVNGKYVGPVSIRPPIRFGPKWWAG